MNLQETLTLFDSCRFEAKIFKNRSNSLSSSNSIANRDEIGEIAAMPRVTPSIDETSSRIYNPSSPDTVLLTEDKFKTIPSWQETAGKSKSTRRSRTNKSVSDLESEEIKGFMDLGFVFTEEDMNSELIEILPGLKRFLGREAQSSNISRPYLSESWDCNHNDRRRRAKSDDSMVLDLGVAKECSKTDMKESLRWWARSLASTLT